MSIFEIQEAAQKNKDIEAYAATMHDDFEFIMHLDNSKMNKEQTMEMFSFMMNNADCHVIWNWGIYSYRRVIRCNGAFYSFCIYL